MRVAALGRPSGLTESWGERVGSLMKFFFGQRKVMEEKSSLHHLAIYWGFLVLTVASVEMFIGRPARRVVHLRHILGETIYGVVRNWAST